MKKTILFILGSVFLSLIGAYFITTSTGYSIGAVDYQTSQREIVPSNYIEPRFVDELGLGNIRDYSMVLKFGQNSDLNSATYEDVRDGGGVYPFPANGTAPITHIVSSSISDIGVIEVQGLNISGYLVSQEKALSGTTLIELDTPLWRVFRLKNQGSVDLIGQAEATDSVGTITYAIINNGNNQTLMAIYTIPKGKIGLLLKGSNNISDATRAVGVSGRLRVRPYGGVFQIKKTFGLNSEGTSYIVVESSVPGMLPSMSDIRVDALASANGVSVNTTFDIMLIDIE